MFWRKRIPSPLLGGAWDFPYTIQSSVYELHSSIASATQLRLFRAEDMF